uniref:Uncharacterized protein n=1 Tax=Lepeophtheirus salmonis TaxID=72036 RepID=A0A0K2VK08_LEPSM
MRALPQFQLLIKLTTTSCLWSTDWIIPLPFGFKFRIRRYIETRKTMVLDLRGAVITLTASGSTALASHHLKLKIQDRNPEAISTFHTNEHND